MSEIKVFDERPSESRTEPENRAYDLLDKLNIKYKRADHEEAETIEKCVEIGVALETKICKNLFLCNSQKTAFYLLMMPGDKPFKTKDLSKQIGSARLSFAPEEFMVKFLDLHPGSVSVLGLMNDKENSVRLLIDKDLLKDEYFGAHPCKNTSTLKLSIKDVINVFLPAVKHDYTVVEL